MNRVPDYPGDIRDLSSLLLGKRLGAGIARTVYECKLDPNLVIKVEERDDSGMFQNVAEWNIWNAADVDPDMKKWLAPCVRISDCGIYLIQKKVQQPVPLERMPKRVPVWMSDMKTKNFGLFEDRVVACDYGTLIGMFPQNLSKRTKKADWWGETEGWISTSKIGS